MTKDKNDYIIKIRIIKNGGKYEKNFFSLLEDDSIPLMKIFIKVLIKNKVIFKFKNGKKNILLLQEDPKLLFQRNPNFFYI